MISGPSSCTRREFTKSVAAAGVAFTMNLTAAERKNIKLGFDNFSVREFGWKAGQLLDYAAELKLDVMFFSDLDVFESHEDPYLRSLKARADRLGLQIHTGTFSICPTSKVLTTKFGSPEEHLSLAIRIARTLGSPVVRCVLGNSQDRRTEGGIERHIEATVKVLKNVRARALDAGVKIAVENHSGDMQAWELVTLIEAAGRDFVGATMDAGNATWTLEDPLLNLEILGPYALTTGIRGSAVWEYADGAMVLWTAIGEGDVDFKAYVERFAQLCPGVPFVLEIISGSPRPFPYLTTEFWKPYPKARAAEFARFLALAKRGKPLEPFRAPDGKDRREAVREYQRTELERSLKYCKETLGLGLRAV